MSHQTAPNVEGIFLAALEIEEPGARSSFLDRVCGDAELRRHVERLLALDAQASGFLESPASTPTLTVESESLPEGPGTVIGPYKLMEQIGEGGMGVVYVAEQHQPVRRKVALKIIKPGMDTKQVIARFEAERQALAMMDHPNIARVFDGGVSPPDEGGGGGVQGGGRPYFVMELVRGIPITDYCDRERLSIPERLELFVLVCRAVQHAHQKGIIHRDLKPLNILVTVIDGTAVPKVIDFGVAKATGAALTERTLYTAFHQFVGTPLSMSPEQADLSGMDVDTRSDIYALGVLLYELLTGTTPFDQETFRRAAFDEVRRIIREQEPPKPSTRLSALGETRATVSTNRKADTRRLDRTIRGELDWVVMKALEKDRRRRYETANDFAADVMRYLTDQPVLACPPSAGYRLRKFVRRNKGPVAAGVALAALLVLGTVGTSIGLVWALQAEHKATEEKERAMAAETKAKQAEANAKEEAAIATAVRDFLTDDLLYQASPDKNARNKKVTVEELLGRAAAGIADKFAQQPRIEAEIRQTIGSAYMDLGDYAAAQPHLERAWEIGRRVLGQEHPRTLDHMNALAVLYSEMRYSQAETLTVRVLEASRRVFGEKHAYTLRAMMNLASLYLEQRKVAQAEPLSVKALDDARRVLGDEHDYTIRAMNNLARVFTAQSKFPEAEALSAKALGVCRHVLGEEHPVTLQAMMLLAGIYSDQGEYSKAEPILVQALQVRRRVLGEESAGTVEAMHNLATIYHNQGELAKAEPLLVRALEIGRRVYGETHPNMLLAAKNLAQTYWPNMKFERSVPLLEDMLRLTRAELGPDHPVTLNTMASLGAHYRDAGRLLEGTDLLEQARARALKQPGFQVDDLASISSDLGKAYEQDGQSVKAESLYRETLETVRQRHKEGSSRCAELQYFLARNLLKKQRYAEAEPLLRECLKFRQQKETNDWGTFSTKSLLGGSLLGQKKYAEAEPLLLAGYEGMKQREGKIPPIRKVRLIEAIELLEQLYEARGQLEKAAEWRAKLPPAAAELPADVFARP
jgi:serine/threonine protein kinase/tetratricopeptide (TPR) repeat protein